MPPGQQADCPWHSTGRSQPSSGAAPHSTPSPGPQGWGWGWRELGGAALRTAPGAQELRPPQQATLKPEGHRSSEASSGRAGPGLGSAAAGQHLRDQEALRLRLNPISRAG